MYKKRFYTYLQFEKRYSLNTLDAYKVDLEQFSDFILTQYPDEDPELISVHHRQIRAWIIQLMDQQITAKSVNRKISTLKTYFRFLLKQEAIQKNPMAKVIAPKMPKPLPVFIETNNMNSLFGLIENEYPESNETEKFIKARDGLIIEILYSTGIRRAELLGLKNESFNQSSKTVKVLGKGNKERIIPVSDELLKFVFEYIGIRNKLVGEKEFLLVTEKGKKAYPGLIHNIVSSLLQHVSTLTRKSPHVLRHTFATHLSNSGAELNAIKELLGHASLASTQVYTHNTIDKLKDIHRHAHPKG
jgi:integrase/recombinase XerC